MKSCECSVCAIRALTVAISAFTLIALFWAIVFLILLMDAGPSMVAAVDSVKPIASNIKITDAIGGIIAFAALIVAVGSLWISLRHHRLSVRPKISIVRVVDNNDGEKKGLYLRNHGLGPALITDIKVELKSTQTVISSYEELMRLFLDSEFRYGDLGTYWLQMLPKDACERLFWLESNSAETDIKFDRLMSDIRLTITYESFYKEREVEIHG